MKQKVEIELDWPHWAQFWMCQRNGVYAGFWKEDPREYKWTDTQDVIVVERPKSDPKFMVHTTDQRFWAVVKTGRPVGDWVALFDSELDPDAERHARQFADMLNREVEE